MADIAIKVRQAGFSYSSKTPVFSGISCDIRFAEIFSILGPNGQGKTSFMKTLMKLLALTHGTIEHNEVIGYVPQHFSPAFSYSVFDIVLMGRAMHISNLQSPSMHDRQMTWKALSALELDMLADREFNSLSGGQKQLVLIARAIAMECRVLLLDEPTSALDLGNQQRVLKLMQHLARNKNIAVVFSTHQPDQTLSIADQAMLMSPGAIAAIGPAEEILTSQRLSLAYGTPLQVMDIAHEGHQYKTVITLHSHADLTATPVTQ